ncbi:MAG: hypothetical protein ACRET1_08420 [Burkholderiales bacterium]
MVIATALAIVALIAAEKDMLIVITHHDVQSETKQYYIAALTAPCVPYPEGAFSGTRKGEAAGMAAPLGRDERLSVFHAPPTTPSAARPPRLNKAGRTHVSIHRLILYPLLFLRRGGSEAEGVVDGGARDHCSRGKYPRQ